MRLSNEATGHFENLRSKTAKSDKDLFDDNFSFGVRWASVRIYLFLPIPVKYTR